ncbi:jg5288 [Pararge aegeria aegeria]|uniref:Jg5288 protein n=1 Tax=Pararge aegeria aegeria TaxID=348720 RepID=A0A8S4R8N7_9NEOP|nr:jg5288 [Pararge aegeria aegeria]
MDGVHSVVAAVVTGGSTRQSATARQFRTLISSTTRSVDARNDSTGCGGSFQTKTVILDIVNNYVCSKFETMLQYFNCTYKFSPYVLNCQITMYGDWPRNRKRRRRKERKRAFE